jgi:hypothetical protein
VWKQRRVSFGKLTANDTVVAISNDIAGVVKNILSVLPDTRTVAVVVGNSPLENYWMQQAQEAVAPLTNRVAFTWFNDLPFEQMLKRAAELPPKSAIFFLSLWVDAAGVSHEEVKSLRRLRAVANAPISATWMPIWVTSSLAARSCRWMTGEKTADVAMRILGGEVPGDIKTPPLVFGITKIRLEGIAALEHQRKPPAARKRSVFSDPERLGAISLADMVGARNRIGPSSSDLLAGVRARAP